MRPEFRRNGIFIETRYLKHPELRQVRNMPLQTELEMVDNLDAINITLLTELDN